MSEKFEPIPAMMQLVGVGVFVFFLFACGFAAFAAALGLARLIGVEIPGWIAIFSVPAFFVLVPVAGIPTSWCIRQINKVLSGKWKIDWGTG